MAQSQGVHSIHVQRPVPCDSCDDDVPGTHYCRVCIKTLCEECKKSHKDHKVVLRARISEEDTSVVTCADHFGVASFHCEKCNIPVCHECVTGKHQLHKMMNLNKIVKEKKELIKFKMDKILNTVLPKLKTQEDEIKRLRENYNKKIQQVAKKMEKENKALHEELDRINQKRLENLYSTQKTHMIEFDNRVAEVKSQNESCQIILSDYQDAIRENCLPAIIDIFEREDPIILRNNVQGIPEHPCFESHNIHSLTQHLRRFQFSSPQNLRSPQETQPVPVSKFNSPLKGRPRIFVTKEGYIWLGSDRTKKLIMVNSSGQVVMKRDIQIIPYALAEMENGNLIISPNNNSTVKSISMNSSIVNIFDPSPSKSLGVSVTFTQEILICLLDGRVMKSNFDGTNTREIYKFPGEESAHHAVENIDGDIFVSSCENSLAKISKDGKLLSRITHTSTGQKMARPNCLTVDRTGNILCTDIDNHCVYIIGKNQTVTELVGKSHGISHPTGLVVDGKTNLWITQQNGSINVLKY